MIHHPRRLRLGLCREPRVLSAALRPGDHRRGRDGRRLPVLALQERPPSLSLHRAGVEFDHLAFEAESRAAVDAFRGRHRRERYGAACASALARVSRVLRLRERSRRQQHRGRSLGGGVRRPEPSGSHRGSDVRPHQRGVRSRQDHRRAGSDGCSAFGDLRPRVGGASSPSSSGLSRLRLSASGVLAFAHGAGCAAGRVAAIASHRSHGVLGARLPPRSPVWTGSFRTLDTALLPHGAAEVVRERLAARGRLWVHRRAAECCVAHRDPLSPSTCRLREAPSHDRSRALGADPPRAAS